MDPPPGVEPGLTDPKSVVLPLHQGGIVPMAGIEPAMTSL